MEESWPCLSPPPRGDGPLPLIPSREPQGVKKVWRLGTRVLYVVLGAPCRSRRTNCASRCSSGPSRRQVCVRLRPLEPGDPWDHRWSPTSRSLSPPVRGSVQGSFPRLRDPDSSLSGVRSGGDVDLPVPADRTLGPHWWRHGGHESPVTIGTGTDSVTRVSRVRPDVQNDEVSGRGRRESESTSLH